MMQVRDLLVVSVIGAGALLVSLTGFTGAVIKKVPEYGVQEFPEPLDLVACCYSCDDTSSCYAWDGEQRSLRLPPCGQQLKRCVI